MIESSAILLRRIRFSEASLIVTWFSETLGKLKTVAKGALRPRSAFVGKLDLFYEADLMVVVSKKSELHTLTEVKVKNAFDGIRRSYRNTLAASYFSELVEEVTELEHPVTEIYELLVRAFRFLDTHDIDAKVVLFFESELCKSLGIHSGDVSRGAEQLIEQFGRLPQSRRELLSLIAKS